MLGSRVNILRVEIVCSQETVIFTASGVKTNDIARKNPSLALHCFAVF